MPGMPGVPGMPPSSAGMGGRGLGSTAGSGGAYIPSQSADTTIVYAKFDAINGTKLRPAEFVYPKRMVIITGAVPYKEQVEKFRQALRYPTLQELVTRNPPSMLPSESDMPQYIGYDVERRILLGFDEKGNKRWGEWTKYDLAKTWNPLAFRIPESEWLPDDPEWVEKGLIPPDYFALWLPLPKLPKETNYPPRPDEVKLASIYKTIENLKAVAAAMLPKDTKDAFDPANYNPFSAGGRKTSVMPTPNEGPKSPLGDSGQTKFEFDERSIPDALPMRFVDVDILPGVVYQYRIRLKLLNPNYGKDKLVATESLSKVDKLYSDWSIIPEEVFVPAESFLYAHRPATIADIAPLVPLQYQTKETLKDQVIIQMHVWFESIKHNNRQQPVGDWVVRDMVATKGAPLGRLERVPLPLWDPKESKYYLEVDEVKTIPEDVNKLPSKVRINFNVPRTLLMEFEGAKQTYEVPTVNPKDPSLPMYKKMEDESNLEILYVGPDGLLRLQTSGDPREKIIRERREKAWRTWVQDTYNQMQTSNPSTPNEFIPKGPDDRK